MKIHMLSPPNTIAIDAFSFEPCTQRTRRFPTLFNKLGYEVIYYGHAKSDVDCEVVEIVTDKQLEDIYGYSSQNTSRLSANYLESNSDDPVYVYANQKSTEEIEKRIEYGDIISIPGFGFWPLVEQFDQNKYALVETSIGYPRLTVKDFRVFQSYTHMALMCGLAGTQSPELSDAVIPNFYDATSFEYCEDKEDYCLYLGRLIESKGLDIAIQLAQVCGFKLKIAGTGMRGKYLDNYELRYEKVPENVEILGAVEPKERNKLLAKAKVLFLPTLYTEAFGGVVPEAHFSGTPTITTDFGIFCFSNIHGKTGYKCKYFQEFIWAYENIDRIDPKDCLEHATANYTIDGGASMYGVYFDYINNVYNDDGFYSSNFNHEEYFLEGS